MLKLPHFLVLAMQTLRRNKIQGMLAMLGVTVGVGALVTSIALGRGAQQAITEQLMAVGANMIVVTAGNYQVERSQDAGVAPADHGSVEPLDSVAPYLVQSETAELAELIRPALYTYDEEASSSNEPAARYRQAHYEDDPNALHDHPTAAERLGDTMAGLGAAATLSLDDADAILNQLDGVQFVASGVHENARVQLPGGAGRSWFTRLHGTEPDLPEIRRGWTFPRGRFFNRSEFDNAEQVMVLGQVVADRLFGRDYNPVGDSIELWNQEFTITGVIGSRSWVTQPTAGDDQFDAVYVPVSTVHRLLNLSMLNTITVTTQSAGDTTTIAGEITELLRQRHGISEQMPDDFTVKTQAEQILGNGLPPQVARIVAGNMDSVDNVTIAQLSSSLERANSTMMALLAGVAAVSLMVGGIGVANLLLLSVTQRTREVGLRVAMGARGKDIAMQFVLEAVILSLLGGIIGAAVGYFVAGSLEGLLEWSTDVSVLSTVLAIIVAAVLGVVSGLYPARKAARLDPIGALHHE